MAKKKKAIPEPEPEKIEAAPIPETEPVAESKPEPEPELEPVKAVEEIKPARFKRPIQGVSFLVFSQVGGIKSDQLAGFRHYVRAIGLKSMTIKEWHEEYQKFLRLPV